MLTDAQLAIVKATVPVLQQHGETITRTFYGFLFEENPQLKNIFNMAHQAKGEQPRALAGAVIAYAAHIDEIAALGPAVATIAHKHASLDVLAEHYPIVGRNLLKAIGHVLGDAATPEIVDAWGAAYGQLAQIMIGAEADLYSDNEARGWAGFKPFRVAEKIVESAVITSFKLAPVDGQPLPAHLAGQYLSVRFEVIPGSSNVQMRQYTVSCAPNPDYYRISVRRESGGVVSSHLHEAVTVGDEVLVHMPQGEFTVDESANSPIVLLSGGVGATPLLAILNRLVEMKSEREIVWVQAAIDGSVRAFGAEVDALAQGRPNVRTTVIYESPRPEDQPDLMGRINVDLLRPLVPVNSDVYFCGPKPFMAAAEAALVALGISEERRHHEVFGPTTALASAETVGA